MVVHPALAKDPAFFNVDKQVEFDNLEYYLQEINDHAGAWRVKNGIALPPIKDTPPRHNLDLLIVVLPDKPAGTVLYQKIKYLGDCKHGLATQCMQAKTCRPKPGTQGMSPLVANNLSLKINPKRGGINWQLQANPQVAAACKHPAVVKMAESKALFIGIDVSQPMGGVAKETRESVSVIGITFSIGDVLTAGVETGAPPVGQRNIAAFSGMHRVTRPRQETVIQAEEEFYIAIRTYFAQFMHFPSQVVFMRDGVANTSFRRILHEEVEALCNAIDKAAMDTNQAPVERPKITYMTVQKNHHTRLFCDSRDAVGREGNVPPGTVVDTAIVHPEEFDFFLCSHQGIKGTSKPAHYYVMRDDNHFGPDGIQNMCFALCHLYFRCTKSVSIPAPVYYARKVAERGRFLVNTWWQKNRGGLGSSSEGRGGSGSGGGKKDSKERTDISDDTIRQMQLYIKKHEDTKCMYFM